MSELKEKAREVAENAQDITRDKIDSFKKLSREQQILIIAFASVVLLLAVVYVSLPGKLDIVVTQIVMDGVMENEVVVTNIGEKPLKKLKVVLNEKYEYRHDVLGAGETLNIGVTSFRLAGNPEGKAPSSDTRPRTVKVSAKGGNYKVEF